MNRIALILVTSSIVLISSCSKQQNVREVDWAKAALARNPAVEIISTDENAGVFTVRDTSSGSQYKVRVDELIAGPPHSWSAPPAVPAPAPAATPDAAIPEEPAKPTEKPEPQTTETLAAANPHTGESLAEGPGYRISKGQPATPPPTMEGPGYSIKRDEPVSAPPAQQSAPNAEATASNAEKRTDPIICQGDRLMRIDGESIDFEGDAVIAEKGCDLFISNARIRAGGVGIIARQARVHIVNSTIGGSKGSYEASDGAEIYVAHSTFAGVGRRFDSATMNDLGGNEYKLAH